MNYKEQIKNLGFKVVSKGEFLRRRVYEGTKIDVALREWEKISDGMPFILFDRVLEYVSFNILLEKGYIQPKFDVEEVIDKKCREYFGVKVKESNNNKRYDRLKNILENETFDKIYVIAPDRHLHKIFLNNAGLKPNEAILIEDTIHFNAVDFEGSLIILLGEWHHSRVFENVSSLERLRKNRTFTIGEV